jgi:hypothetical protein
MYFLEILDEFWRHAKGAFSPNMGIQSDCSLLFSVIPTSCLFCSGPQFIVIFLCPNISESHEVIER